MLGNSSDAADERTSRRESLQIIVQPRRVCVGCRIPATVMLGVWNQPQFLGICTTIEERSRDLRSDIRVTLAVNH